MTRFGSQRHKKYIYIYIYIYTYIYFFTTHKHTHAHANTHTIQQCSYTECGPHSEPYKVQLLSMCRSVEISFFSSNRPI